MISDDPLFLDSVPGRAFSERPLGFLDIGARDGIHPLIAPFASLTKTIAFEPDREAARAVSALPMALSNMHGRAQLHLCAAPTNHSLRPINRSFVERYNMVKFAQVGTMDVRCETLDSLEILGEFLKLDTQGSEYEILQGSERTLREHTAAIYCEVEFLELYQGQKLFSDIEQFLRGLGFSFFGFENIGKRSRRLLPGNERLLHADAVFFKDPIANKAMTERQKHVAFVAALLCGYYDFALEIIDAEYGSDRNLSALAKKLASLR